MELTTDLAIRLVILLVGFSTAIQSVEMIHLRTSYWPWSIIRQDYLFLPKPFVMVLDFTLSERRFYGLNIVRLIASLSLIFIPHFATALLLFLLNILICLRYRGTFNGGSDFMTLITLMAITVALLVSSPAVEFVCLWYVAIQSCSSYFIGGFIKLKRQNWRNGTALLGFMGSTIYKESSIFEALRNRPVASRLVSWAAIAFETGFPLLVFFPPLTVVALILGLSFHLFNAYLFGLNRFTFAWVATYPALYYCSQSLHQSFS